MTNADKIRAMTDEELCEWLCGVIGCCDCADRENCEDSKNYRLVWLKQEVEE